MRAVSQLVRHLGESDDRPCDQLRKHRDEAGEVDKVAHRLRIAAIDIDRIAHRLECIERNAERKGDPHHIPKTQIAEPDRLKQEIVILNPEVEVFKKAQQGEIRDHGCDQRGPLHTAARDTFAKLIDRPTPSESVVGLNQSCQIIDERRDQHQDREKRVRPTVKKIAHQREQQMLASPWHEVIQSQRERQEVEDEEVRAEDHMFFFVVFFSS